MTDSVFNRLFSQWNWKPIRNCPGRFILAGGAVATSASEIADTAFPAYEFSSPRVPDRVTIMKFEDGSGGLISFIKEENKFLHTLNDADGFERKLRQLEIVLSAD